MNAHKKTSLQDALTSITGPDGDLENSAGPRWKKTGEGEGGMIGIELIIITDENGERKSATSHIVDDYNCTGMFRAAVNKNGKAVCRIWRAGEYDGLEGYELEGKEYDLDELRGEKYSDL
jgi:L-asparaginase